MYLSSKEDIGNDVLSVSFSEKYNYDFNSVEFANTGSIVVKKIFDDEEAIEMDLDMEIGIHILYQVPSSTGMNSWYKRNIVQAYVVHDPLKIFKEHYSNKLSEIRRRRIGKYKF